MAERLTPLAMEQGWPSGGAARERPSKSYRLDLQRGCVAGMLDGQAAMEQAIWKILQTQLFEHDIYSGQYGFAGRHLLGRSGGYLQSEVKRRVREALLSDGRITALDNFVFSAGQEPDALALSFRVTTVFSTFNMEGMEVKIK